MNSRQGRRTNLQRLKSVQKRVRALVDRHPWLGEEMRRALEAYTVLVDRYQTHLAARRVELLKLACGVLERGLLGQKPGSDEDSVAFVKVRGRWPRALAVEIDAERAATGTLPRELEARAARAVLAGMYREQPEPVAGLSEGHEHGSEAERCEEIEDPVLEPFVCYVKFRAPDGLEQPPDPASLELRDLRKLSDADFRTVALYRLSGIADAGAARPILPEPASTISSADQLAAYAVWAAWHARLPQRLSRHPASDNSLEVCEFPADLAEQMLECVRKLGLERGMAENAHPTPSAVPAGATDLAKPTDPTMRDLAAEAGISDDTFRRVRKEASIEVQLKGGAARNRRYTPEEVDRLIKAASAGNFLERRAMAEKWAQWGSK